MAESSLIVTLCCMKEFAVAAILVIVAAILAIVAVILFFVLSYFSQGTSLKRSLLLQQFNLFLLINLVEVPGDCGCNSCTCGCDSGF